jgi:hypothetical protein
MMSTMTKVNASPVFSLKPVAEISDCKAKKIRMRLQKSVYGWTYAYSGEGNMFSC